MIIFKAPERRWFKMSLRTADSEAGGRMIAGHAALFNSLSQDLGGFVEQIAPGAFAEAIAEDDVRCLWNHDSNYVLGRNTSGTLRMKEDNLGLAIECDPPPTQWANDLLITMDRGDVDQMSFGFETVKDAWDVVNGVVVRTLIKCRLYDVSPVTYPAYLNTDCAVRSMQQAGYEYDSDKKIVLPKTTTENRSSLDLRRKRLELIEKTAE